MEGIYAIFKPVGPTSHDIINQLRRVTGVKKIGHAGTLDPLASGVLVVGIGRSATKSLSAIVAKEKEYLATIKLGLSSTTDDAEGEKTEMAVNQIPSKNEIETALKELTGSIFQTPPIFSAIKKEGQSAYKLARQGKVPVMESRKVLVKKVELLGYAWPQVELRVVTGPGVYIRALARDLGVKLGTGGYLTHLERTRVGDYTKDRSVTVEEFSQRYHN